MAVETTEVAQVVGVPVFHLPALSSELVPLLPTASALDIVPVSISAHPSVGFEYHPESSVLPKVQALPQVLT